MNQNNILPSLVSGFGASVFTLILGFNGAACCLFVPLAAIISLVLHQKVNKAEPPFKTGLAILFGFLTGIFAAVFSTLFATIITLITHSNEFTQTFHQSELAFKELEDTFKSMGLAEALEESRALMESMRQDIIQHGFSLFYTVSTFFSSIIFYSIFGMIGGLLGLLFINKKKPEQN